MLFFDQVTLAIYSKKEFAQKIKSLFKNKWKNCFLKDYQTKLPINKYQNKLLKEFSINKVNICSKPKIMALKLFQCFTYFCVLIGPSLGSLSPRTFKKMQLPGTFWPSLIYKYWIKKILTLKSVSCHKNSQY